MNVPYFSSSWSHQMKQFLADKSDEEILHSVEKICESWGDKGKWDRPLFVILDAISPLYESDVKELVGDWAGVDIEC